MVTVFVNGPSAAALYPTLILADAPGSTGSLLHSGVVQPQDACTLSNFSGSLPLLVNSKICVTGRPCGILPKSKPFSFSPSASAAAGTVLTAFCAVVTAVWAKTEETV